MYLAEKWDGGQNDLNRKKGDTTDKEQKHLLRGGNKNSLIRKTRPSQSRRTNGGQCEESGLQEFPVFKCKRHNGQRQVIGRDDISSQKGSEKGTASLRATLLKITRSQKRWM